MKLRFCLPVASFVVCAFLSEHPSRSNHASWGTGTEPDPRRVRTGRLPVLRRVLVSSTEVVRRPRRDRRGPFRSGRLRLVKSGRGRAAPVAGRRAAARRARPQEGPRDAPGQGDARAAVSSNADARRAEARLGVASDGSGARGRPARAQAEPVARPTAPSGRHDIIRRRRGPLPKKAAGKTETTTTEEAQVAALAAHRPGCDADSLAYTTAEVHNV